MSAFSEMAENIAAAETQLAAQERYVSNSEVLAAISALRDDFAEVKALVNQIADQAGPIISQIAASPLVKMLGGK